jgi:rhodanese-related sulfurtransferase
MNFENIINPVELEKWINEGKNFQLVDITEENILKTQLIEFIWIPVSKLFNNIQSFRTDIPVVLCCQHGESSFLLMNILHYKHNLTNIYSLKSGFEGWKNL